MKRERTLKNILIIMTLLLTVVITACSGENGSSDHEAAGGGTLVVGMRGDPVTFNPDARPDDHFYYVAQNIYSRLVKLNYHQEIVPDLAKEWHISDDGLEYTFYLHEGVTWHDGQPFTSADVKFTLDTIREKSFIAGSFSSIAEVETPDDHTVVVRLAHPDAAFLGNLSWYGTFIVAEHIYNDANWDSGLEVEPVGTGPFRFSEYTSGVSLTLERNDDYFGHVPHVDRLVFSIIPDPNTMIQSFYNGDLDILGTMPPSSEVERILNDPEIISEPMIAPNRNYVIFNVNAEPFNDLIVRRAFALAIDNEDISSRAMKGQSQPAEYFISPSYSWALADEHRIPSHDPMQAMALLEQAGYTKGADGFYLAVEMDVMSALSFPDIAQVMKDQLAQAGIDLNIQLLDTTAWMQKVYADRNFKLTMMGGYHGPDIGALQMRIGTEAGNNPTGYSNAALDEAFSKGASVIDEAERVEAYTEVQRILSEDLPMIPLVDLINIYPYHSRLQGHPSSAEAAPYTGDQEYNYIRFADGIKR